MAEQNADPEVLGEALQQPIEAARALPTTAILPMFPVDAARLSGQLFSEVRAAERPCAKHQQ